MYITYTTEIRTLVRRKQKICESETSCGALTICRLTKLAMHSITTDMILVTFRTITIDWKPPLPISEVFAVLDKHQLVKA